MRERAMQYRRSFKCVNAVIHKTWRFETQEQIDLVENMLDGSFSRFRNPEWMTDIALGRAVRIMDATIAAFRLQDEEEPPVRCNP